jgi:VCBS repeat-containing protein
LNEAGKFDGVLTDGQGPHAHGHVDSISTHAPAGAITVPDAHLLFSGDYHKSGHDLIISDHLHRVVVPNYFHGDKHPTLVSPDGAPIDPKVIDALAGHTEYAQAGGSPAAKVVGHVAKMTGSASVVRNGVTIDVQNGDAVYQSDVVQTGSGSTLGLVLSDGTTFNLSAGARLMLNDLTYDASSTSNSALFTLVQGAASFVAGQVAKTGDMKVATPVATMGIRGTAVVLDIDAIDGAVSISVVDQHDGTIHAVQVFNAQGIQIGTVTSNGSSLTLTPTATFDVIARESNKTPAQIAQEFIAFQAALDTYNVQKAIDPSLPQHTDNANPQTRYAANGSTPANSPATEYHAPAGAFTVTQTGGTTPGTTNFIVASTDTGSTGAAPPPPDSPPPPAQTPASTPFVVTPPTVAPITSGEGNHTNPVMSASGDVVYDPDGIVYFYDRASGVTTRVTPAGDGFSYSGQTISSDGRYVVYQGTDGTHTYVYVWGTDPSDTAHYHVQTQLAAGSSPAISGDGSTILVEQAGGSIGIYDLQGHAKGTITAASVGVTGTLSNPAISADGHVIAFWSSDPANPSGPEHLYTYNVSTGVVTEIASSVSGGAPAASISADGHYVVYQSQAAGGHTEISLYDLTTGQVVYSTASAHEILAGNSKNPVISPDGHFIIFTSTAELTPGDTNTYADTYVVDVTDPAAPVYTLISEHGDAPSDSGVAISAGGLFVAFGSAASFYTGSTGSNIFVADPTSGRSAIIQETASSPDHLTASGVIGITGGSNGVTLTVTDRDGHPTDLLNAVLSADGQSIQWNFSEVKSDFASLHYGQDLTQQFLITLNYPSGKTTVSVTVDVHDAVQPVVTPADVAPVATPVTLADGQENHAYVITPDVLLAHVGDIDGPQLSITDVSVKTGGGSLVHNEDGSWTYTPAEGFQGEVVFNYTASDGTLTSSSTANLSVLNHPATIDGASTGNVVEDTTTTTGGTLVVHDVDNGEAVFQPVAPAALNGSYGNFTFDANTGAWTYALVHDEANGLADGQVVHDQLTVTSADGTASQIIDVTVTGTNDAPVIADGTVVSGAINVPAETSAHNTVSPTLASELAASGLISGLPNGPGPGGEAAAGLGGATDFGTLALPAGDDNSSGAINITSVFGADGVNFFGHNYTSLYINNNGNITFNAPNGAFTPSAINAGTDNPIIAAFWADVDTRGHGAVYYDLDAADGVMTITWDDVGYYSFGTNKLDSFQLVLINEGNGNFDIEYRFGGIQWTTGSASGGSNGLGGTPARVGYSAGDGVHYFELPQSGNQSELLDLSNTNGNTGIAGVDHLEVRNGEVGPSTLTSTGIIDFSDPDLTDTHSIQSVTYTGDGTELGTLSLVQVADTTGTGIGGQYAWTYTADPAAVRNALDGTDTHSKVETFDVVISDGHGGTLTQTVSVSLTEPFDAAPVATPVTLADGTEDTSYTVTAATLLTGVTDTDGPSLSISSVSIATGGGSLVDHHDGTWSYTPDLNYNGPVSFNYTATDGTLSSSSTASLTLAAVDDAPVATSVTLATGTEDTTYTIHASDLLTGVSDVDGPSLSISSVSIASGGGSLHNNDDGTWSYTPAANYNGPVSFNYTASDGTLTSSSTASLTLAAVDDAPVATPVTLAPGTEDTTYTISTAALLTGVTDVDGPSLSISSVSIASGGGSLHNNDDGTWSYTPAANYNGPVSFNYTTSDGTLTASSTASLALAAVNDAPVIAAGTDASASINVPLAPTVHNNVSAPLALELANSGLISGLPGESGFGSPALGPSDDGSSGAIDITSVFGAGGVNFFGHHYTSLYINNNGNITFNAPNGAFTPSVINAGANNPIIAAFWADVDTRAEGGGTVSYDLDAADGVMTITWNHVGYYSEQTNKLDTFQLVLINEGSGNFDIEYRYGNIQWTTGGASGGLNGLGGTVARAGYSAGDGTHYFELPQSGNQAALLNLPNADGNTGIAGVDHLEVRNGEVGPSSLTSSGTIDFSDPDLGDTHSIQSVTYTGVGTELGTLSLVKVADTTGTGTGGQFTWNYTADPAAVQSALAGIDSHSKVETFDVVISDGHGGTVDQTVSVALTEPAPMVTITVLTPESVDFHASGPLAEMGAGTIQPGHSSTAFTIVDSADHVSFVVDGSNFTYSSSGDVTSIAGGTLTSFHEFNANGVALADFTGLAVDAFTWMNDVKLAHAGNTGPIDALTSTFAYTFTGGSGNDAFGSAGHADTLSGGAGNDTLDPGGALSGTHDTVTGGSGSDTFIYQAGYGAVTITDFDQGNSGSFDVSEHDKLEINGFGGDPNPTISPDGHGNTTVDFGNGDVLTLLGVADASQIPRSDIIGGNGNNGGNNSGGPVISNADNTVTYTATPVLIDPSVAVSDDTATVTSVNVWISAGFQAGDQLTINGSLDGTIGNADGSTIHYHYDASAHGVYLYTSAGNVTLGDYDAALQQIQFSNTASDPTVGGTDTARTVTWAAHDDANAFSQAVTTTVHVDDAPVIAVDDLGVTQNDDGTTTVSGLSVTDADATASEIFTIAATTVGAASGTTVSPASSSGHLADINTTLQSGVTYDQGENPPSTDMVTLTVADAHGATDTVNLIFNVADNPATPVTLAGTANKDVFFGTGHQDQFVFAAHSNHDTIMNFTPGQDHIDLSAVVTGVVTDSDASSWFGQHVAASPTNAADTLVTIDAADTIVLHGVTAASLSVHDFILHPGIA